MIFAIEGHIEKILSGEKTETRRLPQSGETCTYTLSESVPSERVSPECALGKDIQVVYTAAGRLKYRVGNTYAIIPKRGQHGIKEARVKLLRIQYSPVWAITSESAQAEGGYTQAEYLRLWASMADKPALKLMDDMAQFPELDMTELAQELRKRPAAKWHCWHLTFQVEKS